MLEFLIQRLKVKLWTYGPIKSYTLNLDGVEVDYPILERYEIDELKTIKDEHGDSIGENLTCLVPYYHRNIVTINNDLDNYSMNRKIKQWAEILSTKLKDMHPAICW